MASFEDGGIGGELWIGEHDLSFDGFGGIAHEKCREMADRDAQDDRCVVGGDDIVVCCSNREARVWPQKMYVGIAE